MPIPSIASCFLPIPCLLPPPPLLAAIVSSPLQFLPVCLEGSQAFQYTKKTLSRSARLSRTDRSSATSPCSSSPPSSIGLSIPAPVRPPACLLELSESNADHALASSLESSSCPAPPPPPPPPPPLTASAAFTSLADLASSMAGVSSPKCCHL
eukprot:751243-Hanusia_phi.AAC.2